MEKPSPHPYYKTTYEDHRYSLMEGSKILDMFYNQGIWKENYIPKELEDKGWRPDEDNLYRVWWDSTDPADPADPGHDYLIYIELAGVAAFPSNDYKRAHLWSKLISKLGDLSNENLIKVFNFINSL